MLDYDPRIHSLLHPETIDTLFRAGRSYSPTAIAAEMAHLAYYSFEASQLGELQAAIQLAGFDEPRPYSKGLDSQAFACRRGDGVAVIAFRGTQPQSLQDIVVDASADLVDWIGVGRVHRGFRDAFETARADLEHWMKSASVRQDKLIVCGHSLGGALATLAGSLWQPAHVVTIGAPRVGDAVFARSVAGPRCRRIFNCCDLVARVPPRAIGYDHPEPSLFIRLDGAIVPNPGAARIDAERHAGRGAYFAKHVGWGNAPVRDLADHSVVNYLRAFFQ